MINLETAAHVTESQAIDAIFNACRANPQRVNTERVSFNLLVTGDYEAALRDADGVVIAIAHVDEYDV